MSLLTRLSAWLRTEIPLLPPGGAVEQSRMPTQNASVFHQNLVGGVRDAYQKGCVHVTALDPSIFIMVIPSSYGESPEDEDRLANDIDEAMHRLRDQRPYLTSLSWSTLKDANLTFLPDYTEWAAPFELAFDSDASIVFFIDTDAIGACISNHATKLGLRSRLDPDGPVICISDSRFEARVALHALVAEALWTAKGPLALVKQRTRQLPGEFRGFTALLGALRRRFLGVRFDIYENIILAQTKDKSWRLDYRHLVASIRHSGSGFDAGLIRATLEDLEELDGSPTIIVKSPTYLRAYPDALSTSEEGYALVAMREQGGRQRPVLTQPDDPAERFAHHEQEAHRQLGLAQFSAKIFGFKRDDHLCVCLVGDQIASLISDASLIVGVLKTTPLQQEKVFVRSVNEAMLVITAQWTPQATLDAALNFSVRLMKQCGFDAGSLDVGFMIDLPQKGAGIFDLERVPTDYMELMVEADKSRNTRPARADYLEGVALFEIGKRAKAQALLERALRQDREAPEVNLALGRLLSDQGDNLQALPFLTRAASTMPDVADASNDLGIALRKEGDLEGAIAAFEKANQTSPDEPEFLMNLGRSLYEGAHYDKAEEVLLRTVLVAPRFADAHATLALLFSRKNMHAQAKEHARKALSEKSDLRGDAIQLLRLRLEQILRHDES